MGTSSDAAPIMSLVTRTQANSKRGQSRGWWDWGPSWQTLCLRVSTPPPATLQWWGDLLFGASVSVCLHLHECGQRGWSAYWCWFLQGREWEGFGRTEVTNILNCIIVVVSTIQVHLVSLPLAFLPFTAVAFYFFVPTEGLWRSCVGKSIGAFFPTALLP